MHRNNVSVNFMCIFVFKFSFSFLNSQKKKGNTKSNPNKKLRKQNMATAVHDQNPVYVMRVGKGMKVFLDMEDLAGKQANPRNRPSDVTNVQLHDQERERTASI